MMQRILIITDKYPIDPDRSPAAWMLSHLRSLDGVADVTVVSLVRMLPRLKNLAFGGYDRRWFRVLRALPKRAQLFPHVAVHHRFCFTLPDLLGWRINPRLYLWQQSRWLRSLIHRHHFDAVLLHYLHAAAPLARMAASVNGVPLWMDENETLGSMPEEGQTPLRDWLLEQLVSADAVIAQCGVQEAEMKQALPGKRVHVIPLAVEDDLPAADPPIPPPLHCICVSRLDLASKNVDPLLRAVERVRREEGVDLRLTVAGDGFLRPALQQLARNLGIAEAVHFAGWLPQSALHNLMCAQHIAVQPSQHESFGLVALEAAAAGVPLIAGAKAGVVPDLVALAAAVRPLARSSPEEIARAILEVLGRLRVLQHQALEARGRVCEQYSWRMHARGYSALLATLE
ncbi:MAG: glycosyltransferase [Bacteroidetes bacterium]|nr:glycosyltransferase [Bacteroidota bacterium]